MAVRTRDSRLAPRSEARREAAPAASSRRFGLAALSACLIAATGLGYEVALTSIFSVALQYHAVHLAVAVAISGMGVGALLAGRAARNQVDVLPLLPPVGLAASLAMLLATWGAFRLDPGSSQLLIPALAFLPFLLLGAALAIALRAVPENAPAIYAADLAGGALGVVGVLLFLNSLGGPQTALLLAVLPAAAALAVALGLQQRPGQRAAALLVTLAVAGLVLLNGSLSLIDFDFRQATDPSGDKTMLRMLREEGARVVATRWNAFGRTDLVQSADPAQMHLFVNGGAGAPMYRFDGDLEKVAGLREYMEFMPFAITRPQRVLVIGAGGGIDVLMALLGGAREVDAVEINPGAVQLVKEYREYNGQLFEREGVRLIEGDGRNFVARSQSQYDLILLNLVYTQAAEARSYALSENYIFTEEAFRQYIDRLSPTGSVAVITHNPLEATRAWFTGLSALSGQGRSGEEVVRRTAIWFWPDGPLQQKASVVLLRSSPFSKEEGAELKQAGLRYGLKAMYLPHVEEFAAAPLILGKTTVASMVAQGEYNFWPTSDSRPFFYNLQKGTPEAVRTMLVLAGLGLFLLTVLAIAWTAKAPTEGGFWSLWLYFGLIGVAYMLIQVPVINRAILLLGSPTLSVSLVLGAMLLGGAAGSAASRRLITAQRVLPGRWLGLAIALGAGLYLALLPALTGPLLPLPLGLRASLFGLLLLPLSFLMGMPFPTGLRYAVGLGRAEDIPILYGINGAASVLGSAAAMAVAIGSGYTAVMLAGAALYALLPLAARKLTLTSQG